MHSNLDDGCHGCVILSLQSPGSHGCGSAQPTWDKAMIASERVKLTNRLSSMADKARAVTVPHRGDCLYALLVSSCGLRLEDSAVHNARVFDWEPGK